MGGLILFGRNIESAGTAHGPHQRPQGPQRRPDPLLIGVDQEGRAGGPDAAGGPPHPRRVRRGLHVGLGPGPCPGAALAAECADFGFHLDFAPVLDVWSNPDNTVIGKRAFGSDWKVVSGFGAAVSNALQAAGVIPVVKHFPAMGTRWWTPIWDFRWWTSPWRTSPPGAPSLPGPHLGRRDPPPGRAEAVPAVMVAHILMTQLGPRPPLLPSPRRW